MTPVFASKASPRICGARVMANITAEIYINTDELGRSRKIVHDRCMSRRFGRLRRLQEEKR